MTASSIPPGNLQRRAVFEDTAGWMACADATDLEHAVACAARDRLSATGRLLVTTDFSARRRACTHEPIPAAPSDARSA